MHHKTVAFTVRIGFVFTHIRSFTNICRIDTDQGSWPSLINRNWLEASQEIQAPLLGPLLQHGGVKTSNRFSCSLPVGSGGVGDWFLVWGEGRGVSRGQAGGGAQGVYPPLWWCWVQGACAVPCFSPSSSEVAAGVFLVFLYLAIQNLPQLCMQAVIFSLW